jgi:hypothetical protein
MVAYHEFDNGESSVKGRAIGAFAAIAALCALFAFAPRHDTTKVVGGIPCSILSEDQISAALGTPMRLVPTSGSVCRYVSTGAGSASALFVIARREPPAPVSMKPDGMPLRGVGDAAVRSTTGLDVRYGPRWYAFIIVPNDANDPKPLADEIRLAKLVRPALIAQNR